MRESIGETEVGESELRLEETAAVTAGARVDVDIKIEKGSLVGRYVVLSRLGAGAMGVVHAAYDPELDRKVAIKLVKTGGGGEDAKTRLLREAQALAKLSHPHVVAVHDVGTMGQQVWIAMEYVEGRTLTEWATERERDWEEVVAVMRAAGLGLASAHAAGLLHRDFKPDNVMVGTDGRVRVMDFGLARADLDPTDDLEASSSDVTTQPGFAALAIEMTRAGTLMGTPAYMAPEQLETQPASARSDQFAYCVTFWEMLYGTKPFAADNLLALFEAVMHGRLEVPPDDRSVPPWLKKVCMRGLALDPKDRFEDMAALIEALAKADAAGSGWRRPAMFAGLAVIATGLAYLGSRQEPDVCNGGRAALSRAWTDADATRIEDRFKGLDTPFAEDAARAAVEALELYADEWRASYRDACEDTAVRKSQSEALLDKRMACLDRRLDSVSLVVETLSAADVVAAEKAIASIEALPSLEPCAEPRYLEAQIPPPDNPAVAREVGLIRKELARAQVERTAGHAVEMTPFLEKLEARVEATGYRPLQLEYAYQLGNNYASHDEFGPAAKRLEAAYYGAVAIEHDEVVGKAAMRLAYVAGYGEGKIDKGLWWAKIAEAEFQHSGTARQHAQLDDMFGILWVGKGEYEKAIQRHEAMLAYAEAEAGSEPSRDVASALMGIGDSSMQRGDFERANASYGRALEIRTELWGHAHPEVAVTLSNIGTLRIFEGRYGEARDLLQQSLDVQRAAYGERNAQAATLVAELGTVAAMEGDLEGARERYAEAAKELSLVLGDDHPNVLAAEVNLASIHLTRKEYEEARVLLERAHRVFVQLRGDHAPQLIEVLHNLALVDLGIENFEAAIEKANRCIDLRSAISGQNHADVLMSLTVLAEAELEREAFDEARRAAERGFRVSDALGDEVDPIYRAQLDLLMALALEPDRTERERASTLAHGAKAVLETRGELGAESVSLADALIERLD